MSNKNIRKTYKFPKNIVTILTIEIKRFILLNKY